MRKPTFIRSCFFVLLAVLVVTLAGERTPTYAAGSPSIAPTSKVYLATPGLYFTSYANLTEAVTTTSATSIHITNGSSNSLRTTWTIKVDSELMLINQLTLGASGAPDTMVVSRGQGGTTAATHAASTNVKSKAVAVDIFAQNVSAPTYGLGAFKVQITIPPGQLIDFSYDSTWLISTGRTPRCLAAVQESPGVWTVQCATLNNPGQGQPSWYPPGPNGSGRIARITILPPATGLALVPLTGSFVTDVQGTNLGAIVTQIAILSADCPDTNMDNKVNTTDLLNVAMNLGDAGVDSGATILNDITSTQTLIAISDQSLLSKVAPNNIIAIDNESMTVVNLGGGSPGTMTVTRGTNYPQPAAHKAGSPIYRATTDGNHDGKRAYSPRRDVTHDRIINMTDLLRVASFFALTQTCPAPP